LRTTSSLILSKPSTLLLLTTVQPYITSSIIFTDLFDLSNDFFSIASFFSSFFNFFFILCLLFLLFLSFLFGGCVISAAPPNYLMNIQVSSTVNSTSVFHYFAKGQFFNDFLISSSINYYLHPPSNKIVAQILQLHSFYLRFSAFSK
jgi:hypothetical protein